MSSRIGSSGYTSRAAPPTPTPRAGHAASTPTNTGVPPAKTAPRPASARALPAAAAPSRNVNFNLAGRASRTAITPTPSRPPSASPAVSGVPSRPLDARVRPSLVTAHPQLAGRVSAPAPAAFAGSPPVPGTRTTIAAREVAPPKKAKATESEIPSHIRNLADILNFAHPVRSRIFACLPSTEMIRYAGVNRMAKMAPPTATSLAFPMHMQLTGAQLARLNTQHPHLVSIELDCQESAVGAFTTLVRSNPRLTSIRLLYCDTSVDTAVAAIGTYCRNLISMSLYGCRGLTNSAVTKLAADCSQLTAVDLSGCTKLSGAALRAIGTHCRNFASLTLLGCSQESLSYPDVRELAMKCTNLTAIDVRHCPWVNGYLLLDLIRFSPGLTAIHLGHFTPNLEDITLRIIKGFSKLTTLDISDNSHVSQLSFPHGFIHEKLSVINLGGCENLLDNDVLQLSSHCRNLTSIDLSRCNKLTNAAITALATYCLRLAFVDLQRCDWVTQATIDILTKRFPNIEIKRDFDYAKTT